MLPGLKNSILIYIQFKSVGLLKDHVTVKNRLRRRTNNKNNLNKKRDDISDIESDNESIEIISQPPKKKIKLSNNKLDDNKQKKHELIMNNIINKTKESNENNSKNAKDSII